MFKKSILEALGFVLTSVICKKTLEHFFPIFFEKKDILYFCSIYIMKDFSFKFQFFDYFQKLFILQIIIFKKFGLFHTASSLFQTGDDDLPIIFLLTSIFKIFINIFGFYTFFYLEIQIVLKN